MPRPSRHNVTPKSLAMLVVAASCLLSLATGCGTEVPQGTPESAMNQDLVNLGEMYRMASLNNKRPPKDYDELTQAMAAMPGAFTQLNRDNVVVFWGATLPSLAEEPGQPSSDQILAYEKQVPEKGGAVLMLDRTVRTVTPEEFKSMPKAGPEPPADQASTKS